MVNRIVAATASLLFDFYFHGGLGYKDMEGAVRF